MRSQLRRAVCAVAFGVVLMGWSAVAQDRTQRPAPGGQPGGRPSNRPGPGDGARPQPGRPGPGQGSGRPSPGSGPGRPQPGRPGPGRPQPNRPVPGRPIPGRPGGGRPPSWGRPPQQRPSYAFRPNDRDRLLRHYRSHLRYINRSRRPLFSVGGYFPYGDVGYLSPLPVGLYAQLPPPPFGYQMGYFDGYVVVYDPVTYFIANMVDLLAP